MGNVSKSTTSRRYFPFGRVGLAYQRKQESTVSASKRWPDTNHQRVESMAGDDTLRPESEPVLLVLNQMAGPMTWELVVDLARTLGPITLLTGHPDTLKKGSQGGVRLVPSVAYKRGSFLVRSWRWLRYSLHAQWWLFRQSRSTPHSLILQSTDRTLVRPLESLASRYTLRGHGT